MKERASSATTKDCLSLKLSQGLLQLLGPPVRNALTVHELEVFTRTLILGHRARDGAGREHGNCKSRHGDQQSTLHLLHCCFPSNAPLGSFAGNYTQ
jgi:hypothetical protein